MCYFIRCMLPSWFLFALIPPFLYAITNHIDKALLSHYFKDDGVGTLVIFSALLSIVVVPVAFLAGGESIFSISNESIIALLLLSIPAVVLIWSYLMALSKDDSTNVIIFYQLVPVMSLVLGYIILGEVISNREMWAMFIIILGTSIASFEINAGGLSFKRNTVFFMLLACFCWAIQAVVFKKFAIDENSVWIPLFWENLGIIFIGVLLFIFLKGERKKLIQKFKAHSASIMALNITNEVVYLTGNVVAAFALMMAPVALILLTETFQAIFVFLIGLFLTIFFPKIYQEKLGKEVVIMKVLAIIITTGGVLLL